MSCKRSYSRVGCWRCEGLTKTIGRGGALTGPEACFAIRQASGRMLEDSVQRRPRARGDGRRAAAQGTGARWGRWGRGETSAAATRRGCLQPRATRARARAGFRGGQRVGVITATARSTEQRARTEAIQTASQQAIELAAKWTGQGSSRVTTSTVGPELPPRRAMWPCAGAEASEGAWKTQPLAQAGEHWAGRHWRPFGARGVQVAGL